MWNVPIFDATPASNGGRATTKVPDTGSKPQADEVPPGDINDSITKLTDHLSFMKNEFQETINERMHRVR